MVDVLIDFYECSVRAGVKLSLQRLVSNRPHGWEHEQTIPSHGTGAGETYRLHDICFFQKLLRVHGFLFESLHSNLRTHQKP